MSAGVELAEAVRKLVDKEIVRLRLNEQHHKKRAAEEENAEFRDWEIERQQHCAREADQLRSIRDTAPACQECASREQWEKDNPRPYRCGAFVTGTGEQCILESDHAYRHIMPSDLSENHPAPPALESLQPLAPGVLPVIDIALRDGDASFPVARLVHDIERAGFRFPQPFVDALNAWVQSRPLVAESAATIDPATGVDARFDSARIIEGRAGVYIDDVGQILGLAHFIHDTAALSVDGRDG